MRIGWLALAGVLASCVDPSTDRPRPIAPEHTTSGGSGGLSGEMPSEHVPNSGGAGAGASAGLAAGAGGDAVGQPLGDAGSGGATEPAMFDAWVGTAEDRNDVAGGAVCERIATIQCAGEGHCCEEPGRSFEACKQTMKQGCIDGLLLDQTTANAVAGYDRGFAAGVLTEYERRARQCDISVAAWGASTAGFRALNRGTLASGASCKPSALDIFGQTPMAVAHMFACTSPETQACLPTATEWRCVSHAAEGGACFTDLNCAEGLFCTNSKARSPGGGTCEARKADGAACDFPSDCSSLACKGGTCAPASQQTIFCLQ